MPDSAGGKFDAVLAMHGIGKSFAGVPVLRGVDLSIYRGEVHALMGENGAGKSTLMKIAAGIYPDYDGHMEIDGQPVRFAGPREATAGGVAIIHQELNLVPDMTVAENIFLGRERLSPPFFVDTSRQEQAAADLLATLGFHAAPSARVRTLRVGEQQLVEIAKALSLHTRILIMDEPTSALSTGEAERLHGIIRRLSADGVAIVYISHRMEEIFEISDTVTVLRDGRLAGTNPVGALSRGDLIRLMVGRDIEEFFTAAEATKADTPPPSTRQPLLSVRGVWLDNPRPTPTRPRLVDDIAFDVAQGEVLGLAGLMGAGRTELLETLFGARADRSGGEIRLAGQRVAIASPAEAKAAGIALVTEDRKRDGLVLGASVGFNISLTVLHLLARLGLVSAGREARLVGDQIAALGVRCRGPAQPAGTLSGGNQQKVVVAKWLATKPRVLLLDEPTRGIDVGAKAEIYRLIRDLSARGIAMVLASSEMPELLALSDRILVMREGRSTALLERDAFDAQAILDYASPGGAVQPAFQHNAVAEPWPQ